MNRADDFCIIGAGKLGLSLANYITGAGSCVSLIARSDASCREASKIVNPDMIFRTLDKLFYLPKTFIIAVQDAQIAEIAETLADMFEQNLRGRCVMHCSGALEAKILKPCKACGANIFAAHPFQTFARHDAAQFENIYWGVEQEEGREEAEKFVRYMHGNLIKIHDKDKNLYHLTAVLVSNYVNATVNLGKQVAELFGMDLREPAMKIITQTAQNALSSPSENISLTGPIARGDLDTIAKHLTAIKDKPEILAPYCYFGLATLEMVKNSQIDQDNFISNARIMLLDAIASTKSNR